MTDKQEKELLKHHAKIDEKGNTLVKGTMIWVINEALENIKRLEELIGPAHDRPSKKDLKVIIRDLRDQLRELKIRID
jgi:hypothetical protein